MATPLQYLQPGHSYPAPPYSGPPSAATPAPVGQCLVNIQHAGNAAGYPPPTVQQTQAAALVSASSVPQHVAQSHQAAGYQQQLATAANSSTFSSQVQQTCQNCVAPSQQQAQSTSGYPSQVQQQTTAAAALPAHQPLASGGAATATAQCHPAHTLQHVQAAVKLPSQQPCHSSSTPALYNQQIPVQQEHQQPLPQNTQSSIQTQNAGQAYIQPQLQHNKDTVHSIHQQIAQQPIHQSQSHQYPSQQQLHTPALQQKAMHAIAHQSQDMSQSTVQHVHTPAPQPHLTATSAVQVPSTHQSYPAAGPPDAASQSYAHSALNVLHQQSAPAHSQYHPAQPTAASQTYGGATQMVTPQSLPASSQHSQAAHISQQVSLEAVH